MCSYTRILGQSYNVTYYCSSLWVLHLFSSSKEFQISLIEELPPLLYSPSFASQSFIVRFTAPFSKYLSHQNFSLGGKVGATSCGVTVQVTFSLMRLIKLLQNIQCGWERCAFLHCLGTLGWV